MHDAERFRFLGCSETIDDGWTMSESRKKNWVYSRYAHSPQGFSQGFRDGLGSYMMLWESVGRSKFVRHYAPDGQRGDWDKVGNDLTKSVRKFRESA